jgi:hypothetical protein
MPVSQSILDALTSVADNRRVGEVSTALDELSEYVLAACTELNERATKADQLRERLSDILATTLLDTTIGDALDEPAYWLCDEGELKKHLATLSDALDDLDERLYGAA